MDPDTNEDTEEQLCFLRVDQGNLGSGWLRLNDTPKEGLIGSKKQNGLEPKFSNYRLGVLPAGT